MRVAETTALLHFEFRFPFRANTIFLQLTEFHETTRGFSTRMSSSSSFEIMITISRSLEKEELLIKYYTRLSSVTSTTSLFEAAEFNLRV